MSPARVVLPVHSLPVTTILIGVPRDVFTAEACPRVRKWSLSTLRIIEYGGVRSRERSWEQRA